VAIEQRNIPVIDTNPDVAIGLKLPIVSTQGRLFPLNYTTDDQLFTNVKNLLLTTPGERLFHPTFGTEIRKSLFEPNTSQLIGKIKNSIEEAINFWIPNAGIVSLDVEPLTVATGLVEENGVSISLVIQNLTSGVTQPVTFIATPSGIEETSELAL
jgi:phage baseplate assembly protein W